MIRSAPHARCEHCCKQTSVSVARGLAAVQLHGRPYVCPFFLQDLKSTTMISHPSPINHQKLPSGHVHWSSYIETVKKKGIRLRFDENVLSIKEFLQAAVVQGQILPFASAWACPQTTPPASATTAPCSSVGNFAATRSAASAPCTRRDGARP